MIYLIPDELFEETPRKNYVNLFIVDAPNFWYLHGELERHFHYDKASMYVDYDTMKESCTKINGRLYLNEGIWDVTIEGYDKPCKAYMWHSKEGEHTLLRGLVVDPDDKEWAKDAEEKYKEKPLIM